MKRYPRLSRLLEPEHEDAFPKKMTTAIEHLVQFAQSFPKRSKAPWLVMPFVLGRAVAWMAFSPAWRSLTKQEEERRGVEAGPSPSQGYLYTMLRGVIATSADFVREEDLKQCLAEYCMAFFDAIVDSIENDESSGEALPFLMELIAATLQARGLHVGTVMLPKGVVPFGVPVPPSPDNTLN